MSIFRTDLPLALFYYSLFVLLFLGFELWTMKRLKVHNPICIAIYWRNRQVVIYDLIFIPGVFAIGPLGACWGMLLDSPFYSFRNLLLALTLLILPIVIFFFCTEPM